MFAISNIQKERGVSLSKNLCSLYESTLTTYAQKRNLFWLTEQSIPLWQKELSLCVWGGGSKTNKQTDGVRLDIKTVYLEPALGQAKQNYPLACIYKIVCSVDDGSRYRRTLRYAAFIYSPGKQDVLRMSIGGVCSRAPNSTRNFKYSFIHKQKDLDSNCSHIHVFGRRSNSKMVLELSRVPTVRAKNVWSLLWRIKKIIKIKKLNHGEFINFLFSDNPRFVDLKLFQNHINIIELHYNTHPLTVYCISL